MESKKTVRVRHVGQKNSFPIHWNHDETQAEENLQIEGVGRAGAPIQPLDIPGVSRKSAAQIRELGTARMRITRPGVSVFPKQSKA